MAYYPNPMDMVSQSNDSDQIMGQLDAVETPIWQPAELKVRKTSLARKRDMFIKNVEGVNEAELADANEIDYDWGKFVIGIKALSSVLSGDYYITYDISLTKPRLNSSWLDVAGGSATGGTGKTPTLPFGSIPTNDTENEGIEMTTNSATGKNEMVIYKPGDYLIDYNIDGTGLTGMTAKFPNGTTRDDNIGATIYQVSEAADSSGTILSSAWAVIKDAAMSYAGGEFISTAMRVVPTVLGTTVSTALTYVAETPALGMILVQDRLIARERQRKNRPHVIKTLQCSKQLRLALLSGKRDPFSGLSPLEKSLKRINLENDRRSSQLVLRGDDQNLRTVNDLSDNEFVKINPHVL